MKKLYVICSAFVLSTGLYADKTEDFNGDGLADLFKEASVEESKPAKVTVAATEDRTDVVARKGPSKKSQRLANAVARHKANLARIDALLKENQEKQTSIRKERMALKEDTMKALQERRERLLKGKEALKKRLDVLEPASVTIKVLESPLPEPASVTRKVLESPLPEAANSTIQG